MKKTKLVGGCVQLPRGPAVEGNLSTDPKPCGCKSFFFLLGKGKQLAMILEER
jgi:hypothetical protein